MGEISYRYMNIHMLFVVLILETNGYEKRGNLRDISA